MSVLSVVCRYLYNKTPVPAFFVVCQYLYNKSQCQHCLLCAGTCTTGHSVSVVCCVPVPVQQVTVWTSSVVCRYLYNKSQCQRCLLCAGTCTTKHQCQLCLLYASTCKISHDVSVVCSMPVPVQQVTVSALSVVCQYLYKKSQCQRCLLYASTCTTKHNVGVVCCMPVPVRQAGWRDRQFPQQVTAPLPLPSLPVGARASGGTVRTLCYRFLGLLYIENRSNYIISFINSDTALFSCFFSSSSLALLSMTLVRHFFESKRKENTWWNDVIRRLAVTRCIRRKHTCQWEGMMILRSACWIVLRRYAS